MPAPVSLVALVGWLLCAVGFSPGCLHGGVLSLPGGRSSSGTGVWF